MSALTFPLVVLGLLASYIAGLGLAARWHMIFPLEYLVAGAVHAAWVFPATQRSGIGLTTVCWTVTVWLTRRGFSTFYFAESDFLLAIMLEGVCLLLCLSIAPGEPWPDRLARWRRTRADIVTQLRMGQGVIPWWQLCLRQFTRGAADTPVGSDYQRFAAGLADTEHRLQVRLKRAAMPEQLRQSILDNVSIIVARAETSAAQRAMELEQEALTAAAACREQCERIEDLSAPERQALAGQCEQVFLELTGR